MKDAMDFFFLSPSPVEECEEGHLSFWKGSLFYKDHNMVCLTRPWPSDYLWCPHYIIHLVCLGEEEKREEGRRKWMGTSASSSYCYTVRVRTHFWWSNSMILPHLAVQFERSIPASVWVFQTPSLVNQLNNVLFCCFDLGLFICFDREHTENAFNNHTSQRWA